MKNVDVIKNFVNLAKSGKGNSVSSTGDKLFSYDTIIAERINGKIIVNDTKYSVTTSKAQSYLRYYLNGYHTENVTNVPRNTQSLAKFVNK